MEKDESGALYYTIGWMSSMYLSSNDPREKRFIAKLLKSIKEDFGITDINSLNSVIEDYYHGSDQI
jgi:hypothetical protein